eukprot:746334-Rhodomonas_salina.3
MTCVRYGTDTGSGVPLAGKQPDGPADALSHRVSLPPSLPPSRDLCRLPAKRGADTRALLACRGGSHGTSPMPGMRPVRRVGRG